MPVAGAVVTAYAALERLGLTGLAAEVLPTSTMLPQVGQGALAIQCRVRDEVAAEAARSIDDAASHRCLDAERAFLGELGGGCELPVGALAVIGSGGEVELEGLIASLDGLVLLRRAMSGPDPFQAGPGAGRRDSRPVRGRRDPLRHLRGAVNRSPVTRPAVGLARVIVTRAARPVFQFGGAARQRRSLAGRGCP